jgi:hypothetical protein
MIALKAVITSGGVQEKKEKVQQGYIIKIGPGYALPMPPEDEPWKSNEELNYVKYFKGLLAKFHTPFQGFSCM